MSRAGRSRERYGALRGFEPADADHPLAAGMAAASVTDDTEQAFLVARLLDRGRRTRRRPRVRPRAGALGRRHAREGFARPARAVDEARRRGRASRVSRSMSLDDSARRTAPPCGSRRSASRCASSDLVDLVDRVEEASRVSHNTGVAIAAASAVAAVGERGHRRRGRRRTRSRRASPRRALGARARATGSPRPMSAARIRLARWRSADPADVEGSLTRLYEVVGTSLASQESVPAAFGILGLFPGDPWEACPCGGVARRRQRHGRGHGRGDERRDLRRRRVPARCRHHGGSRSTRSTSSTVVDGLLALR